MNNDEPIRREPITLYRGFALLKHDELPFMRDIDAVAEYIFNEPHPSLRSHVSHRMNTSEAYRRYRDAALCANPQVLESAMKDHYVGDREYSFFVTATMSEEHAVFFAGNSLRNNPFGLVVRFSRDHDYEIYSPAGNPDYYAEALVAGCIEPREIDKILVVGCKAPNQMLIDFLFKRAADDRVRKYRNPDHMRYRELRDVGWTRETLFHPPLEHTRNS